MVCRIPMAAAPAIFAFALLCAPAGAAPEGETPASTPPAAQTEQDNQSYLPPWMQKREAAGGEASSSADPNAPGAAGKAPASGHARRPQRRHRDDGLFQAFRSLWR